MHISVYVRHFSDCPKKSDRYWKRCRCPKWLYCAEWKPDRRSAKTRSWENAEKQAREHEDGTQPPTGMTVSAAVSDYLSDKKEQNIGDEWRDRLDTELTNTLLPWCEAQGISQIAALEPEQLKAFRKTWTGGPLTRSKKQERLRSFFNYCHRHGWIKQNSAAMLSRIKVDRVPTDFFTEEEVAKILAAIDKYHARGAEIQKARQRARAMILLLRWSGLRLGDAARLERKMLGVDGRLFLYQAKTGDSVYVRLPEETVKSLREVPNSNSAYFFWSGNGDRKTVVDDWWRTLSRIFKHADLGKRAHPHMFRDTFAVHLLLAGVPLDQVSILLGHKSIKVTEKHYAPFCKARQDMLDEAVKKSWG
jgi:integrase/recombinase XerD